MLSKVKDTKIKIPVMKGPTMGIKFKKPAIKLKETAYFTLKAKQAKNNKMATKMEPKIFVPNQTETFCLVFSQILNNFSSYFLGESEAIIFAIKSFSKERKKAKKKKVKNEKTLAKNDVRKFKIEVHSFFIQSCKMVCKSSERSMPNFLKSSENFKRYWGKKEINR